MAKQKKSSKKEKKLNHSKKKYSKKKKKINSKASRFKKIFHPKKIKNLSLFKKIFYSIIFIFSLVCLFIFSLAFGIYFLNFDNQFTRYFTKIIPYPAVYINQGDNLSVYEFFHKLDSLENYYSLKKITENQSVNDKEYFKTLKKEILNQMILDFLIEIAANKNGIKVENQELEEKTVEELKQYGDFEKVKTNLTEVYGIKIADYSEYAVKNKLYRQKLKNYLLENKILQKDQSEEEQTFKTKEWIKEQTQEVNVTILFHQYKFNKNTLEVETE